MDPPFPPRGRRHDWWEYKAGGTDPPSAPSDATDPTQPPPGRGAALPGTFAKGLWVWGGGVGQHQPPTSMSDRSYRRVRIFSLG